MRVGERRDVRRGRPRALRATATRAARDAGTDAYDCNGGGVGQEGEGEGPAGADECSAGCPATWPGDGICDDTCNNEACNFDNGDCGESEAQEPEGGQEGEGPAGGDESQEPTDDPVLARPGEQGPSSGCSNTCAHANDHECDDGGANSMYDLCALGTDANDAAAAATRRAASRRSRSTSSRWARAPARDRAPASRRSPTTSRPAPIPSSPWVPVGSGSGSGSGSGRSTSSRRRRRRRSGIYQSASNYNPAARKDDGSCAFMCVVDEPDTIGMTDLYAADAIRRKRKLGLVKQMAEKRAYTAARALHAKKMVAVKRQLVAKKGATLHAPPEKQLAMKRQLQAKSAASKRQLLSPAAMKKKIAAAVSRTPAGKKEMAAKRELQAQKLERPLQDDRVQEEARRQDVEAGRPPPPRPPPAAPAPPSRRNESPPHSHTAQSLVEWSNARESTLSLYRPRAPRPQTSQTVPTELLTVSRSLDRLIDRTLLNSTLLTPGSTSTGVAGCELGGVA